MTINPDIPFEHLQGHAYGFWAVGEIFNRQSQPVRIQHADKTGFVLDLRANLQPVQIDRLIVKAINENVPGYTAVADHSSRTLTVVRHVSEAKPSQPAPNRRKAAA